MAKYAVRKTFLTQAEAEKHQDKHGGLLLPGIDHRGVSVFRWCPDLPNAKPRPLWRRLLRL